MIDTPTMYALACPRCSGGTIRVDELGSRISRVGIDPLTGQIQIGSAIEFVPTEVIAVYQCADCGYDNVVKTMFVQEA